MYHLFSCREVFQSFSYSILLLCQTPTDISTVNALIYQRSVKCECVGTELAYQTTGTLTTFNQELRRLTKN
jgi:hypothetical protein